MLPPNNLPQMCTTAEERSLQAVKRAEHWPSEMPIYTSFPFEAHFPYTWHSNAPLRLTTFCTTKDLHMAAAQVFQLEMLPCTGAF